MTRVTLAAAIAALVLMLLALGWAGGWLWSRGHRRDGAQAARLAETVAQLHACEARVAQAQARAEAADARAAAALDEARNQLGARLAEAEAERDSAMEALGQARRDLAEWRAAYEEATGSRR